MKLDVDVLRYLSKDHFRVLSAVEIGMRNHEIVPSELVERIASLKHGGTYKVLKNLLKHKLLHHDASKYDGFRLTYLGFDFLAIKYMVNRGVFSAVGRQLGVGKESDIFEVATNDGTVLAMKLHRLGRTSFRAIKSKRDYLKRRCCLNWLYLSQLSAYKEYAHMKALGEKHFPVPNAVAHNRHCVVMSLVQGYPIAQVKNLEDPEVTNQEDLEVANQEDSEVMNSEDSEVTNSEDSEVTNSEDSEVKNSEDPVVKKLKNPEMVFNTIIGLVIRLAEHGLIHCDFNEFNIMVDDEDKVTMIDFPQMVSVDHRNAQMYFDRDVECVFLFFSRRFNMSFHNCTADVDGTVVFTDDSGRPCFTSIARNTAFLDKKLAASGYTRSNQEDIAKFMEEGIEKDASSDDEGTEDDARISLLTEANMTGIGSLTSLHLLYQEGDYETDDDSEAELVKRLNKVRQRAATAVRGGQKTFVSRNTYKDKGGKSSQNSKIQKQLSGW